MSINYKLIPTKQMMIIINNKWIDMEYGEQATFNGLGFQSYVACLTFERIDLAELNIKNVFYIFNQLI